MAFMNCLAAFSHVYVDFVWLDRSAGVPQFRAFWAASDRVSSVRLPRKGWVMMSLGPVTL